MEYRLCHCIEISHPPPVCHYSHTTTIFSTPDTRWIFLPTLASAATQSDIQQFNQWRWSLPEDNIRSHRLRAQSHKMVPNFRCPSQVIGSQLLFNLATDWRFPLPSSPWTWLFARIAHRIQGNIFVYQFVKRYDKRYRWTASQIKRCIGWGLGGSWEQSLCLHGVGGGWGVSPSQYVDVFTNLETH